MTKKVQYTILLHQDKEQGGYWVTVPALPGCFSQGDTLEEAIANAREAIALHLEGMVADGEPLPEEDEAQAITILVEVPEAA